MPACDAFSCLQPQAADPFAARCIANPARLQTAPLDHRFHEIAAALRAAVTARQVDVGVDDEAMLLEPEPHIPDIPDVSSIPEAVDIPGGIDICDDVDVPGIVVGSVVAAVASVPVVPDVAMPVVAAVAGAALPDAVPPPS